MSENDLIDNQDHSLSPIVASLIGLSDKVHIILGHLYVPGLGAIVQQDTQPDTIRLLIGNSTNSEDLEQLFERHLHINSVRREVERQLYPKRPNLRKIISRAIEDLRETIALMDQSDESLGILRALVNMVEQRSLHLRIYPRGRLVSKAYLFESEEGSGKTLDGASELAILGSTNLSHVGVAHPAELNVVIRGGENYAEVRRWFDRLWAQSEDYGQYLIEAIRSSWASDLTRPYDVYMKTLYSILKDRLDEAAGPEILWDDEIVNALADYQKVAVRQVVQMVREYGGAFVADVVGLGKSFIGAAILKQFERNERARGLIICPATLVPMWERYNEHYQLNARVVSAGLLRDGGTSSNILLDDERYRHRDFILVDESHNFRNPETQRYRLLQQFLAAGKRCCFLTATPRNKSSWDIYNQIKLFHQDDKTDLPIDPPDLRDYFRLVDRGERSLPELLSNILVRRTRNHIVKWYGFDEETNEPIDPSRYSEYRTGKRRCYVKVAGRKQFFPRRELQTIDYSIEDTYQGIYQDLRSAIGISSRRSVREMPTTGLTFARYAVGRYLKPEKQGDPRYARLSGATAALHGLIRILLFKRFESSVEAFRQTVGRMIASHSAFRLAVSRGLLPSEAELELILQELGEDADLTEGSEQPPVMGIGLEDFHKDFLLRDLDHDLDVLRRIQDLVIPITAEQDAKLVVLLRHLGEPPLVGRKCLIFTQYTDTASYLYRNLDPSGSDRCIDVVHSGIKDYTRIVGRFAPRSNPSQRGGDSGPEITTLIATDVLSEGMNLQDCDIIINYDLHWNPVRLIQRFGRIDRIGTDFETIRGYNFLPEVGLDQNLGLRQRLQRRIQDIHDTIGEDSAILDATERLNEAAMYAIYEPGEATEAIFDEAEASESDGVDLNEAEEILRLLKREDPSEFERIANLPGGIRAGKQGTISGTYVLCRAGRYHRGFMLDPAGKVVTKDMPQLMGLIRCGPEVDPIPLLSGHGHRVMKVKQLFEEETQNRAVEREQTRSLGVGQRYVTNSLRKLLSETEDEEIRARIMLFDQVFREATTNAVRRELNHIRRSGLSGNTLLGELARIYQDHRLRNRSDQIDREDEKTVRVVCSMSLH